MTQARALEVARTWRQCQLDNGVRAASIELVPGVAGSGWYTDAFVRVLGHHIVSRRSQGLTPARRLIQVGHGTLTGPLCNVYGGFDEVARLITLGWANHPGQGGPWSVPGWGTVPRDNGRPYAFGTEFEGGLSEADWTDSFHEFMARVQAGNLDFIGWLRGRGPAPLGCHGEHSTWADLKQVGRKIDRLGYTTASGRARIAAVRSTRTPEDDMPYSEDDLVRIVRSAVWDRRIAHGVAGDPQPAHMVVGDIFHHTRQAAALAAKAVAAGELDEQALAAALAPAVISALGDAKGITGADVEAALRRVLADAGNAA